MQNQGCGDNYISYTIARGQTLYAIARQYNVTVAEILAANPALDVQLYYAGDVICIPRRESPACTEYTIRRGDSFYLISQRTGVPLSDLLAANPGVDPARLLVGQVICIPAAAAEQPCPGGYTVHTVTRGQTFVDLLVLYNLSYAALSQANPNMDLNNLVAGQEYCIAPTGTRGACASGGTPYVLVEGDTLSVLATRFRTSIAALMIANPTYTPTDFTQGRIICLPDGVTT